MSNQIGSYIESINILKVLLKKADAFSAITLQLAIDRIREAYDHEEKLLGEHIEALARAHLERVRLESENEAAQLEGYQNELDDMEEVH